MIRTRFAPSPTGYLHVGSLRTALYDYLIAKQKGGTFVLRIEDTDRERYVQDGVLNIVRSLFWAGIAADEGVKFDENNKIIQTGNKGPYVQSEKLEIYQKYAKQLLDKGDAYYCFCTAVRLDSLRRGQQAQKQPTGYDGHCRNYSLTEAEEKIASGQKYVIRMKMPKEGETVFNDLVHGEIRIKNELVDDQVIIKSDGFPTYHFAVVVDDHEMDITHVIRGDEWIPSVPKHLQLFKYFGWKVPQFAHLPLLLNLDKSKLSKRQGDMSVEDYAKKGYLPEAVINFIAFLGWNPGDERELFTLEELIKEFSLERVGKAGAIFNLQKLNWYNQQYIRKLNLFEFAKYAHPFLLSAGLINDDFDNKKLESILALEKERITTLSELPDAVKFIFKLPEYEAGLLVWKKSTAEEIKILLSKTHDLLNDIDMKDWNVNCLKSMLDGWIKENNYSNGNIFWPLRVALSGQQNSPGPLEIASVLGKEESLRRIGIALEKILPRE